MSTVLRYPFVHEMFQEAVRKNAANIALICGARRLSYAELDAWTDGIAHRLLALGAPKGAIVYVAADSIVCMIASMIACLKTGTAFVMVDLHQPPARLQSLVAQVPPAYLLTESSVESDISSRLALQPPVICVDLVHVDLTAELAEELAPNSRIVHRAVRGTTLIRLPVPEESEPDDLAYIYFTSGSTGRPKAVAGRLSGLDHFIRWECEHFDIGSGTVVSQLTPPAFDPFLRDVFAPLCSGGTLQIPADHRKILDADRLKVWLSDSRIEIVHLIPSLFRLLLTEDLTAALFPALRYVLLAGEPLLPSDVKRWTEIFGDRIRLVNLYGPTETTLAKFFYVVREEDASRNRIPVGRPIPDTECVLLDEQGKAVETGAVGEVHIRTQYRSLGYFGDPERTDAAYIVNPMTRRPDDILYRTGDLGVMLEDGNLELHGRKDQQVKIRGVRIELQELDNILYSTGLVEAAVVASQIDQMGNSFLVAYLVPSAGRSGQCQPDAIRRAFVSAVPAYMVPSAFVVLKELPRTATGKIDRSSLPAFDMQKTTKLSESTHKGSETETIHSRIARVFADVLGVAEIDENVDFFTLGGHSLLATLVVSRLRRIFKADVPLVALFETPTVVGLAARLEAMLSPVSEDMSVPSVHAEHQILPVERGGSLSASFAQQRLWFLEQFQPGSALYNILVPVRIEGALDADALGRAITEVVQRHEVLRTVLVMRQGELIQEIMPAEHAALTRLDLRETPAPDQHALLQQILNAYAGEPFDLARGPLVRALLVRLSDEEHTLSISMHHLVHDDWSLNIFLRELAGIYQANVLETHTKLPALPIQYADFSVWQRKWLRGEVLEGQLSYWRTQLANLPVLLEMPTDRPRPSMQGIHGGKLALVLEARLGEQVRELGRQHEATLFMTLIAVFQVLLMRYSRQEDIAVGTPIANRNRVEIEGLIGFFVNTLIFRGDLRGDPTFADLLARTRETALGAYAHQDLPFEKLVEELCPARNLSHTPLFQVMFALQNASMAQLNAAGLRITPVEIRTFAVRYDLTLTVEELAGGGLVLHADYCTDIFNAETIEGLLRHYENLLRSVTAAPSAHLSELSLLGAAERELIVDGWNATARSLEPFTFVHQLFEAQARRTPNACALEFEHQQLSYWQLNHRSNQLARALRASGVGPEVRVAICIERGLNMVTALLAVLKAGGSYVPLDPEYPQDRLSFIAEDAKVSVLLTETATRGRVSAAAAKTIEVDTDWDEIARFSGEDFETKVIPANSAYVIYTSGSTGVPKGVVVVHRGLTNFLLAMSGVFPEDGPSTWIAVTSICFDISVLELFWTLANGNHVILHPGKVSVQQGVPRVGKEAKLGRGFGEALDYEGRNLQCTPSFMVGLIEQWKVQGNRPTLRKLLLGGEALPETLAAELQGYASEGIFNLYGPTETTVWSSVHPLRDETGPVSIGRPVANTRMYVVDRQMNPVPAGVPGELYIGGDGLAREYWNRPELTAERFIPNPFSGNHGDRLYRTGDLARWRRDGSLELLGRDDNQVKIRGYRIELGEVESTLAHHPAVKQALAIMRARNNNQQLLAYVSLSENASVTGPELRQFLHERIPDYMMPNMVVLLDAMPLTPNGKLDRLALPAPESLVSAEPASSRSDSGGKTERKIAAVWSELLSIPKINLDDNFFDLGGHSLLVIQMRTALFTALNRDIPVIDLFSYPSIRSLVRHLDQDIHLTPAADSIHDRMAMRRQFLQRRRTTMQRERIS